MQTPSAERFGFFFSRVETEREVLSIINGAFSDIAELHGLTAEAIQQWQKRTSQMENEARLKLISFLLHRISARCNAEADQSRVVFDDSPQQRLPIADLTSQLRKACIGQ